MIKVSSLQKNKNNPRQIKDDKFEKLKRSIESFPAMMSLRPMIVDADNVLLGGNMRLSAIKALGMKEIPDDWVCRADTLTDEQKAEFVIKDNNSFGEYDWDKLANEWDAYPLADWGVDIPDFDAVEPELIEDDEAAGESISKAAELQVKWQTATGQLWKLGEHRLICGDCTDKAVVERVMQGEKVDAVVTDPPYGMGLDTDYSKLPSTKKEGNRNYSPVVNDDKPFNYSSVVHIDSTEAFWFGADYYAKTLPEGGSWLVWDKRVDDKFDAMIGSAFELAWSKVRHKREIIRCNNTLFSGEREAQNKAHPTQKPIKVIAWIIEKHITAEGIVLDYFVGSGTTLIACEQLNRKCRAIEIAPEYVAVALERWANLTGQTPELIEQADAVNA